MVVANAPPALPQCNATANATASVNCTELRRFIQAGRRAGTGVSDSGVWFPVIPTPGHPFRHPNPSLRLPLTVIPAHQPIIPTPLPSFRRKPESGDDGSITVWRITTPDSGFRRNDGLKGEFDDTLLQRPQQLLVVFPAGAPEAVVGGQLQVAGVLQQFDVGDYFGEGGEKVAAFQFAALEGAAGDIL